MVVALGLLGALACGAGLATQSRINGELGQQLGDGFSAALFSFASGFVVVAAAMLLMPSGRRGLMVVRGALRRREIPWWYVWGGAAGAFFVLTQGLTASLLGIAVFTVAVVAGQTLSGVLIDRRGIGATKPRAVTVTRALGALLMLAAVVLVVSAQPIEAVSPWLVVMPFIAGFVSGWQQAVNGQVRVLSGSPVTATFMNFIAGTSALAIATLVYVGVAGQPVAWPPNPVLYLGGLLGVTFIALGSILAPRIGVLVLALGTISGQLVTSLLLDLLVPAEGHPLTWTTVAGTALTLVALGIASLPIRSGPRRSGPQRPAVSSTR